jgi:branched-chain amino acid transport system substrate-binding protein
MRTLQSLILTGFSVLLGWTGPLRADEIGVSSMARPPPCRDLRLPSVMRQGILAAFAEINARGGVHGRKLELVSRDDGYDPDRSILQTGKLLDDDKVFALIGAVGTPTTAVTVPIAIARNVPFVGPFTGADLLRAPDLHNVVNIRASYGADAEAWIKHLTEDLHVKRIAIFYQDDSYGPRRIGGRAAFIGKARHGACG